MTDEAPRGALKPPSPSSPLFCSAFARENIVDQSPPSALLAVCREIDNRALVGSERDAPSKLIDFLPRPHAPVDRGIRAVQPHKDTGQRK